MKGIRSTCWSEMSLSHITDASDKMTQAHWLPYNRVVGQLVTNAPANTLPLRCNDISQNHNLKKKHVGWDWLRYEQWIYQVCLEKIKIKQETIRRSDRERDIHTIIDISLEDDYNITSFKKASKSILSTPEVLKLERLLCVSLDNTSTSLKLTFKSSKFCLESFPSN